MPIAERATTTRRLVDRLAIGILVGVVAVSVGGVALLTVYLNRIGDAADGLSRSAAVGAYDGRPAPVVVDGVNALNYLVFTVDESGALESVLIAHLSATRRDLTLVTLPSDLLVDDGVGPTSLATAYGLDPVGAARAVETLTGTRMDHQVRLGLHGFASVVDILGGIEVGEDRFSGAQVLDHLAAAPDPSRRSEWTAWMLRGALVRANLGVAIADPNRFDKVMDALTPCLTVDADLTGDELRQTMVESRVRAERVQSWVLGAVSVDGHSEPDPASLADLRAALAADAFPGMSEAAASRPSPSSAAPVTSPSPSAPPATTSSRSVSPAPGGQGASGVRVDAASPTAER